MAAAEGSAEGSKREAAALGCRKVAYHDAFLNQQDIDLLASPTAWLNDATLTFAQEALLHDWAPAAAADAALIPAATVFLVLNLGRQSAAGLLHQLQLASKLLVCLPINDNSDVSQQSGGSHWSLLVWQRETFKAKSGRWIHYDSIRSSANSSIAASVAGAVQDILAGSPVVEEAGDAPRQRNGYDCGVYVVAVMLELLQSLGQQVEQRLDRIITPSYITQLRKRLHSFALAQSSSAEPDDAHRTTSSDKA